MNRPLGTLHYLRETVFFFRVEGFLTLLVARLAEHQALTQFVSVCVKAKRMHYIAQSLLVE
jgi:hypothetical protein